MLNSATAKIRRQQLKVLEAMKVHNDTHKSFAENGGDKVHTIITTFLKAKSDMKKHKLCKYESKFLLTEPEPTQGDLQVDPKAFHFGDTLDTYRDFVEEQEYKAKMDAARRAMARKAKQPFLRMPNLNKCGLLRCSGCGKQMVECHDVLYGMYCVYNIMRYCNNRIEWAEDTVVRKIFIDTYNRCLPFDTFRNNNSKLHTEWVFPPPCVQDNSYNYAIFWYEWKVEGEWQVLDI